MAQKPGSANKMPIKAGHLFMIGAIVMALITAVLISSMVKPKEAKKEEKKEVTANVVVAAEYIPAGTVLDDHHLKTVKFPKDFLVSDSFYSKKYELLGQMVRSDAAPGEILYKQKLAGDQSRGGLPVLIPEGMRAVSVEISEVKGVAGLIKPGDRVDVLATFDVKGQDEDGKSAKGFITRTVLQDVQVLALAQTIVNETRPDMDKPKALKEEDAEEQPENEKSKKKDKDKEKSAREIEREKKEKRKEREEMEKRLRSVSSVTLALTPAQAEKVALIDEATDVHLALRREGDHTQEPTAGAYSNEIILGKKTEAWPFKEGGKPTPAKDEFDNLHGLEGAATSSGGPSVELIEGTNKSSVNF